MVSWFKSHSSFFDKKNEYKMLGDPSSKTKHSNEKDILAGMQQSIGVKKTPSVSSSSVRTMKEPPLSSIEEYQINRALLESLETYSVQLKPKLKSKNKLVQDCAKNAYKEAVESYKASIGMLKLNGDLESFEKLDNEKMKKNYIEFVEEDVDCKWIDEGLDEGLDDVKHGCFEKQKNILSDKLIKIPLEESQEYFLKQLEYDLKDCPINILKNAISKDKTHSEISIEKKEYSFIKDIFKKAKDFGIEKQDVESCIGRVIQQAKEMDEEKEESVFENYSSQNNKVEKDKVKVKEFPVPKNEKEKFLKKFEECLEKVSVRVLLVAVENRTSQTDLLLDKSTDKESLNKMRQLINDSKKFEVKNELIKLANERLNKSSELKIVRSLTGNLDLKEIAEHLKSTGFPEKFELNTILKKSLFDKSKNLELNKINNDLKLSDTDKTNESLIKQLREQLLRRLQENILKLVDSKIIKDVQKNNQKNVLQSLMNHVSTCNESLIEKIKNKNDETFIKKYSEIVNDCLEQLSFKKKEVAGNGDCGYHVLSDRDKNNMEGIVKFLNNHKNSVLKIDDDLKYSCSSITVPGKDKELVENFKLALTKLDSSMDELKPLNSSDVKNGRIKFSGAYGALMVLYNTNKNPLVMIEKGENDEAIAKVITRDKNSKNGAATIKVETFSLSNSKEKLDFVNLMNGNKGINGLKMQDPYILVSDGKKEAHYAGVQPISSVKV